MAAAGLWSNEWSMGNGHTGIQQVCCQSFQILFIAHFYMPVLQQPFVINDNLGDVKEQQFEILNKIILVMELQLACRPDVDATGLASLTNAGLCPIGHISGGKSHSYFIILPFRGWGFPQDNGWGG